MPENIILEQIHTPPPPPSLSLSLSLCMFPSIHGCTTKPKKLYVQFFDASNFKNNNSKPPGESILLKFYQKLTKFGSAT